MEHFNTHSSNINFSDYIYIFSSNYLFIFVCNHGRDVNVLGVELFFISLYKKKRLVLNGARILDGFNFI